jgi:predicted oxidoreductase (fatty acid repression mutant protein)
MVGPNLSFWNQQLSVAVWAAMARCGVGAGLLHSYSGIPEAVLIASCLRFHIYYMMR